VADYELPDENFYTNEDEWVRVEGKRAYVGVTDYAQDQLGDIVFVELPAIGTTLQQGDTFGVVESVKAVSDLYAPISGEVVEINEELADSPETVNESCYGDGWMIVIEPSDAGEFDSLMNSADYLQYIKDRQE